MDYEKEVHSPTTVTMALDNDPPSYPVTPTKAHIVTTALSVPSGPPTPISVTHPFSAFYTHSPTSSTFPATNYALASTLEAGAGASSPTTPRLSAEKPLRPLASASTSAVTITPSKECSQWPGMRTRGEQMARCKSGRVCAPLRGLTRRQRLWIKVLIAAVVVGVAVAVGVGISKAVGRGVWRAEDKGGSS